MNDSCRSLNLPVFSGSFFNSFEIHVSTTTFFIMSHNKYGGNHVVADIMKDTLAAIHKCGRHFTEFHDYDKEMYRN